MSITALVDRGWQLRTEMALLKKELDRIEEQLEQHGLKAAQQELEDDEREGRRYLAKGSSLVVPVIFTADKVVASFTLGTPAHSKIAEAAAGKIDQFYLLTKTFESRFKDGKSFRAHARDVLGEGAPAFISSCLARDKHGIPKSDIKIHWDRASAIARPS